MKHQCTTCKFKKTNPSLMPCGTCNQIWGGEACIDNWQPAKPKRKDLQAQLDAANARVAELENRENPRPDNRFTMPDITFTREELDAMLEDANKRVEELETLRRYQGGGIRPTTLEVANAEIESMHKELAEKEAIIEEQNRELAENREALSAGWSLTVNGCDISAEGFNTDAKYYEALAECTFLNEWSDIWEIMYNSEEKWFTKMLEERDEALAMCTELADGRYA